MKIIPFISPIKDLIPSIRHSENLIINFNKIKSPLKDILIDFISNTIAIDRDSDTVEFYIYIIDKNNKKYFIYENVEHISTYTNETFNVNCYTALIYQDIAE